MYVSNGGMRHAPPDIMGKLNTGGLIRFFRVL
jgi:hypothetical protein